MTQSGTGWHGEHRMTHYVSSWLLMFTRDFQQTSQVVQQRDSWRGASSRLLSSRASEGLMVSTSRCARFVAGILKDRLSSSNWHNWRRNGQLMADAFVIYIYIYYIYILILILTRHCQNMSESLIFCDHRTAFTHWQDGSRVRWVLCDFLDILPWP